VECGCVFVRSHPQLPPSQVPRMAALPTKLTGGNPSHLLPSELVDKCVGSRIWVRCQCSPFWLAHSRMA